MKNNITLGQLCIKVGMPMRKVKYWIRNGYITEFGQVNYSNGQTGYLFNDKHVSDIGRVNQLRAKGYSLGAAWLLIQRDTKDLGEVLNGADI
jgi:DNA-binding transcriptional MerR regulator